MQLTDQAKTNESRNHKKKKGELKSIVDNVSLFKTVIIMCQVLRYKNQICTAKVVKIITL